MEEELTSVIECLRRGLVRYKQSRPALSWRAIAKQSGVNRYFINKILDASSDDKQSLDFFQVLILTKFLSKKKSIKETIDSQEAPLRDALRSVLDVAYSTSLGRKEVGFMAYEDAIHFDSFIVLVLAHEERGIPRDDLVRILGEKALDVIESLLGRGKVVLTDDYRVKLARNVYLDVSNAFRKLHMQNLIANFVSASDIKEGASYGHILVARMSREGLKEVHEAHREFHRRVQALMEDQRLLGGIPVFSLGCADTMLSNNFFEGVQDEDI